MYSILSLLLIVLVHELGHYLLAIWNGIKVIEFSIGFGKKILYMTFASGTQWQIRLMPLGGFVSLYGYSGAEKNDSAAFCNKPWIARFAVVIAGPLANLILAFVLFFADYFYVGAPEISNVIHGVLPGSYAQTIGVQKGDILLSVNNITVNKNISAYDAIRQALLSESQILIQFRRMNNSLYTVQVKPSALQENKVIGVVFAFEPGPPHQFFQSIIASLKHVRSAMSKIIYEVQNIITKHEYSKMNSIVGLYNISQELNRDNNNTWSNFLILTAILSINLGMFNLLPIPPFDGGKVFIMLLELLLPKILTRLLEKLMGFIGSILIMILLVISVLNDINAL